MPLSATALASVIESKFRTIPIGKYPVRTTISAEPKEDGTVDPTADVTSENVYIDPKVARVIARSVAEAVVSHLLTAAVITGGGTTGPGKIT